MKKLLVVLLALTFVFAFATTAMAADEQIADYTDVTAENEYGAAIMRLTSLGVLVGDGIGEAYRPDDSLTRAEFAKIAVYLTNNEDKYDYYNMMASQFTDVAAGFWGKGWINAADDLGLMIGRGNGTFDPYAKVSYQEVATVVLRALGYDDNLPGDWPYDYNTKAGEVGIVKWVNYTSPSSPISRGEMASIANEALDSYMVSYVANDVAQGLGYIVGAVDKDGYAPFIRYTNEDLGSRRTTWFVIGEDGFEGQSMLNYAFDANAYDVTFYDDTERYSEATGWRIDDLEDWEIQAVIWDIVDHEEWTAAIDFATAYYIWKCDLVDLGGQRAQITVVDDEIIFAEITSDIVRTDDADEEYEGKGQIHDDIDKGGYGELFYDGKDLYDVKDYAYFIGEKFGIFKEVYNKAVYFYEVDGSGLNLAPISLKDDVLFWDMDDAKFVEATDIEVGSVIYAAGAVGKDITLYLVYGPLEGKLSKYNLSSATIDDYAYGVIEDSSAYSDNDGKDFYLYSDVAYNQLKGDVTYVPAYAFTNFAYISNALHLSDTGVIERYLYDQTGEYHRLGYPGTRDVVVGVELLMADGTYKDFTFVREVREFIADNFAPAEGSLVELTLNNKGEVEWIEALHEWTTPDWAGDVITPGTVGCSDGVAATISEKGRLALYDEYDVANEEWADHIDTYTVTDSTTIYVLDSTFINGTDYVYDFDSAKVITRAELIEEGDFWGTQIHVKYDRDNDVSILYIVDKDGAVADNHFGMAKASEISWYVMDEDDNYYAITLGDVEYRINEDILPLFNTVYWAFEEMEDEGKDGILLYELKNNEIVDMYLIAEPGDIAEGNGIGNYGLIDAADHTFEVDGVTYTFAEGFVYDAQAKLVKIYDLVTGGSVTLFGTDEFGVGAEDIEEGYYVLAIYDKETNEDVFGYVIFDDADTYTVELILRNTRVWKVTYENGGWYNDYNDANPGTITNIKVTVEDGYGRTYTPDTYGEYDLPAGIYDVTVQYDYKAGQPDEDLGVPYTGTLIVTEDTPVTVDVVLSPAR